MDLFLYLPLERAFSNRKLSKKKFGYVEATPRLTEDPPVPLASSEIPELRVESGVLESGTFLSF